MAYIYGSVTNCKVRNGQTRTEYECRLGYQLNSQSIENNTSNVTLRLECRSISSSYTTKGSTGLTSVIDGTTVKSNAAVDMSKTNTWQNFGERTITITHNADGTYSADKSGSFTCTAGSSNYSLSSGSASVTVAPATIPRASQPTLSAGSIDIGSAVTIHMNRVSTSFTHYVYAQWASKRIEIGSNITDNISWTLPMDFCNDIPSSPSGWGTIYVDTYSNGTYVGTKSVGFTGTVPASVIPNIGDIVLSEANSNVSPLGVLVQGKSSLNVSIATSGSYGSWITNCRVDGIDNTSYWSTQFTSAVLQQYGERTVTVIVTDSRGRTATKTAKYTCVAYSNPSISVATVTRCNADGTDNEEGEYVKYSFKANIAPINNKNTYSYKLGYKNGNSGYTYITINNSAYSLDVSNVIISGVTFSVDNSYDFEFRVSDYFTQTPIERNIGTGFTLMDFRYTGKGMAIGKVSEKDSLEIGMPTCFNENSLPQKALQFVCGIDAFDDGGEMGWQAVNQLNVNYANSAGSANYSNTATNAHNDANGRHIATGYGMAGTFEGAPLEHVYDGQILQRSGLFSVYDGATWYNVINVRHRNGISDGVSYGMQLASVLTSTESPLLVRNQTNGTWGNWRTLLEISSSNLDTNNGYVRFSNKIQIAWKKISVTAGGTLWTNGIYYSDHSMGNWAASFSSLFTYHAGCGALQYWTSCGSVSNTSAGTIRCFRPQANTAAIDVYIFAIGTWS